MLTLLPRFHMIIIFTIKCGIRCNFLVSYRNCSSDTLYKVKCLILGAFLYTKIEICREMISEILSTCL